MIKVKYLITMYPANHLMTLKLIFLIILLIIYFTIIPIPARF